MPGPDFSIRLGLVGTATVMTGIQSVLSMAGQLVGKIRELAEAADAYGDVVSGHVVSVEQARTATNGLIDSITLHQQAARMEAAGVQLTAEQIRALAVAATNYANTTGADINESFVGLTESVTRCTARGLRPYGIELERGASRTQQQRAILEQLTSSYGDQTAEVEGTADAITSLQNNWTRAWNEMLLAVETNAGPLRSIIMSITSVVEDLGNALETQRQAQEHMRRMGTVAEQLRIQNELEAAGYDLEGRRAPGAANAVERGLQTMSLFGTENPDDWAARQAETLRLLEQRDLAELRSGAEPVVRDAPAPLYTSPDAEGGGGGGRGDRRQRALDALGRSSIGAGGWEQFVEDAVDRIIETKEAIERAESESETAIMDARREAHEQYLSMIEERTAAEEAGAEQMIAANERYLEALQTSFEAEQTIQQKHLESVQNTCDAIELGFGTTANVVMGITGAVKGLVGENEAATKALAIVEGTFLVGFNVAKAATEIALAVSDTFNAGRHAAAAAEHTAAAVVAGINLGSKLSAGSKSSGSKAHYPEQTVGRMEQGYQPTTIVHVNGVVTSAQVNEDLLRMQRDASRGY